MIFCAIVHSSNMSSYLLYNAEACSEIARPISASLRPASTAPFKGMSQRWRTIGNTVFNLTCSRFEPQTFRSRANAFQSVERQRVRL